MAEEAGDPIIIVKKRKHGSGHHGGAWKVAYADFATAMMALFIVLWLTNSTEQVRKAVGGSTETADRAWRAFPRQRHPAAWYACAGLGVV